jgi:hypothetical protein
VASISAFIRMMVLFWKHGDVLEPILKKLPETLPKIGDELKKSGKFTADISKMLKDDGGNPINAEKVSKQMATILENTEFPSFDISAPFPYHNQGSKTALRWAAFTIRQAANSIKIQVPTGVIMNPKTVGIAGFNVPIPDVSKPLDPYHISITKEVPDALKDVSVMLNTTADVLETLESDTVHLIKQTENQMTQLGETFGTAGSLLYTTGNYVYCAGKIFRLEPSLPDDEMQCTPP